MNDPRIPEYVRRLLLLEHTHVFGRKVAVVYYTTNFCRTTKIGFIFCDERKVRVYRIDPIWRCLKRSKARDVGMHAYTAPNGASVRYITTVLAIMKPVKRGDQIVLLRAPVQKERRRGTWSKKADAKCDSWMIVEL
jgi:hypothetical protein